MSDAPTPTGVGLGLRAKFINAAASGVADGRVAFFEVSPENYMRRGGKLPRLFESIAERHPIITHGLMMSLGGPDPLDREYFETLAPFCRRFGGAWHSDHLCFSGTEGVLFHDLLPLPLTERSADRVASRVREASERLEKPMLVENISYYAKMGADEMDEAGFVRAVTERADCGLLLDVNNIYVNAQNQGFDPMQMLAKMPLERVRQLHIAGHESWSRFDMFIDNHGATVLPQVRKMMKWVVERVGPVPVLLERDKNIPPLAELLDEVALLQQDYDEALARFEASKEASRA